jgi:hypothetical protein
LLISRGPIDTSILPKARRDRESQAIKPKQPLLHMNKNIHGIPTNGVLFELKISWWHSMIPFGDKILLNLYSI